MYQYKAYVVRVVDGDTIDVDVDLGFGMTYKKQRVRMVGIDTPESRTRDLEEKFFGKASKAHLKKLLEENDNKVYLTSHDKGKFGRILGDLRLSPNDVETVNQIMIKDFHAVEYYGGNKELTEKAHLENRVALGLKGLVYGND
jgi:micrococcal nuclease